MDMSKHPIIVIEGPDGVGKTTLADKLCKELGAHYLHLTYRWPTKMFDYHTAALFFALKKAETQPVIIDRWWPSEVAYANVYRGGSKWPYAHRMFEKAALRHNFTYVFCLPQDRQRYVEHFERLKNEREEMYSSNMGEVYDEYVKTYKELAWHREGVYRYDFMTQGHDMKSVVQNIIEASEDIRTSTPRFLGDNTFMNFSGNMISARHIFVGDEPNTKTRREVWPFFEYGNCSLFMAEALEKAAIPESHVAFINANHPDQLNTERFLIYLDAHAPGNFIAMGGEAKKKLIGLGIKHRSMHHPQYYRRFKRSTMAKDLIRVTEK